MQDKLKPLKNCPFCNAKAYVDNPYFAQCSNALCTLSDWEMEIEEWNTRAADSINQALLTALKDVMDDLKSRAKWDDDVKTIPLGCGAFERAEAALAMAGGESE